MDTYFTQPDRRWRSIHKIRFLTEMSKQHPKGFNNYSNNYSPLVTIINGVAPIQ